MTGSRQQCRLGRFRFHVPCSAFLVLLCSLLTTCAPQALPHPDEPQVRSFLNRYFETWSNQDMEGYAASFHPQARITFLASQGQVVSQGLTDFLHSQRMSHQQAAQPMKEVPLHMDIQMDDRMAQAMVTWVLTKKEGEERGTDAFTLQRDGVNWKIISLVFYGQ